MGRGRGGRRLFDGGVVVRVVGVDADGGSYASGSGAFGVALDFDATLCLGGGVYELWMTFKCSGGGNSTVANVPGLC